ncbi:chemotaxis protein MotC [Microvirga sp. M2]|uniref:chemotaxis protein MotC n=1 Tax=Microvirga sp. M2 TaxID=3073270 RepID=UPI0039C22C4B
MNGRRQAALMFALLSASGAAIAEAKPDSEASLPIVEEQAPKEGVSKPVQMVRTLQMMQDQIALGSTDAHTGQRGLLTILDSRFMAMAPEVWMDRKNVHAAIALTLSGGKPQILRKLLEMGDPALPLEHRTLVEGALAYVEGREEEAKSKLMAVDLRSLPPMLGAQIALVQSALLVRSDVKKSGDLLDFVRLQAPGTLLEEGALRRQVFVASQTGEMKKFLALTSDYLRRYRRSVYAGNFRQRLAAALTRIDFGKDPALFADVVKVLEDLELEPRLDLYLLAARSSVDQGFTESARMLADKAQELSEGDVVRSTRAKLYRAAAMIVLPESIGSAVADLKSIDGSLLPERDATILATALSIAGQIRQPPAGGTVGPQNAAGPIAAQADAAAPKSATTEQAPEQPAALSKARHILSRIDKLIKNQASTVQ